MKIEVIDNNATWELDGSWYCQHDGDTHKIETSETYWSPEIEDSVDVDDIVEVCNSCNKQLLSDGEWEL